VLQLVEDAEEPHAGPNQIRVAVEAAGVNPADWKFREGLWPAEFPQGTGLEVAGVVDEIGPEITDASVGDQVFGATRFGAAEFAVLEHYALMPRSLGFIEAAGLPVVAETAMRTLDLMDVGAGQTVLINGAAGAVGITTVQLARLRGARVIGTASPGNHEYLRSYGAEPTMYGGGLVERVRELAPDGIDCAIDDAGGGVLPALVELTGAPDRVVTIAEFESAASLDVRTSPGADHGRAYYALREVAELIDAGRFWLPVAQTFPLEEIAAAHRLSETGHVRGKLVLVVADPSVRQGQAPPS
jgi:NADPH:quinone reductase-like Zn-dependent oxidoreductase